MDTIGYNGYNWTSCLDILFRICPEFISEFSKDILKHPFISYISFHNLFISFDTLGHNSQMVGGMICVRGEGVWKGGSGAQGRRASGRAVVERERATLHVLLRRWRAREEGVNYGGSGTQGSVTVASARSPPPSFSQFFSSLPKPICASRQSPSVPHDFIERET